jgi:DNA-binding NarL/FixJ family response regulator
MLRVLIADEHPIVRRGIRRIVEAEPSWSVCGEAADGLSAVEVALQAHPDIAILEVRLPAQSGILVTGRLKRLLPSIEVLVFTAEDDEQTISSGLAAGARGYLLKSETVGHLTTAIAALAAHRSFFSPTVSDLLLDSTVTRPGTTMLTSFTGRELDVMQFVCAGVTNADIAKRLGIGKKTVETHRASAMRKAGAHTAGELTRFAIKNRLIQV